MYPLRLAALAGLGWVMASVAAIAAAPQPSFSSFLLQSEQGIEPLQRRVLSPLVSLDTSGMPIVQTEDWTTKDIKLPWNQVALDKSFGTEELVVFTKSYKFKLGFVSNRKERVHARWTQSSVEIFIMRGRDCGLVFGCESATSYALPKRLKVTVGGQDYFLKTVEQNTYELTPELKQAITQTSGRLTFKVDERVNFEVQEDALPGLKQLFALQRTANTPTPTLSPSVPLPSTFPPANSPIF